MVGLYSGREIIKALEKADFFVVSRKGSHVKLRRIVPPRRTVIVPDHREVAIGTFRSILRQADLTLDEFLELI